MVESKLLLCSGISGISDKLVVHFLIYDIVLNGIEGSFHLKEFLDI